MTSRKVVPSAADKVWVATGVEPIVDRRLVTA